jgi:hypothetical protein
MTILLTILSFLLITSIYYCIKFALIIIKIQESIEDSIDIIEDKYEKISEVLEIPVFYDSPEVKKVVEELDQARLALLYVGDLMTNEFSSKNKKGSEVNLDDEGKKD